MSYDAAAVAAYYDQVGRAEWDRFDVTLGDRVSLALHTEALERWVPPGARVLEIGAGPGRFTEVLHRRGCRIVVTDLSPVQLACNEAQAGARGFASSVERWLRADICDLSAFPDAAFDAVVAFGGPLSYVFDHRDRALAECRRVARRGAVIVASVMSLWGTTHRLLPSVLALDAAAVRDVARTGDLTAATNPRSRHHCHMFRAAELRELLERHGLAEIWLSASSALATGVASMVAPPDSAAWSTLLALERAACVEPGYLDAGTHLLCAARVA